MKKIFSVTTLVLGGLLAAGSALAHDDAYLDTQKAPHGGQLRMAGVYHFELVVDRSSPEAKEKPVAVYLTDHAGQKIPAAGATGSATLLSGKTRTTVTLTPDGNNPKRPGQRVYARPQSHRVDHACRSGGCAGALYTAEYDC